MIQIQPILKCFPVRLYQKMDEFFLRNNMNINYLEEIRIRVAKPVFLKIAQKEYKIEVVITPEEITEILQHICENSIYAYQSQICSRIYYHARRT